MRAGRQRGLTLVELLVALAVLALLASLSYRGIASLVEGETRVRAEAARWQALARVVEQMQRDLSLAIEPPALDAHGTLVVRRRSDADPASGDVRPRNVAFRVDGERLQYLRWSRATGALPEAAAVLENVRSLEWHVLRDDGKQTALAPNTGVPPAARALETRLTFSSGEQVRRIFLLP